MMKRNTIRLFLVAAAAALLFSAQTKGDGQAPPSAQHKAQPPRSVRLYVFDCGVLHNADMGRFNLKKEDVTTTDMSMGCFLIAHPKGNLIWDTGAIPDNSWTPTGHSVTVHVTLPDGQAREADVDKSLQAQLAEIGYSPSDINYLALSHYHYDHTANANAFPGATWLVRQAERDAMFGGKFSGSLQPSTFSALQKSKTIILKNDEYDVFGDASVIIKSAPGHTQGHQVLYVKLAKTGGVALSGGADPGPRPDVRVQPGADSCESSGGRRLPEENRRAALDPARFQRQRETEEISTVLRVGPSCMFPGRCLGLACSAPLARQPG